MNEVSISEQEVILATVIQMGVLFASAVDEAQEDGDPNGVVPGLNLVVNWLADTANEGAAAIQQQRQLDRISGLFGPSTL